MYDRHPELREAVLPVINKHPRQIWIDFGNAMRAIYPDIWVDIVRDRISSIVEWYRDEIVHPIKFIFTIPDVRFPNEVAAVKSWGGHLVKISRASALVAHDAAETALENFDGWDHVIHNDGTLGELKAEAVRLANLLTGKQA